MAFWRVLLQLNEALIAAHVLGLIVLAFWSARFVRALDARPPSDAEKPALMRRLRYASLGATVYILAVWFGLARSVGTGGAARIAGGSWLIFVALAQTQLVYSAQRRLLGLQATRRELLGRSLRGLGALVLVYALIGGSVAAFVFGAHRLAQPLGLGPLAALGFTLAAGLLGLGACPNNRRR